MLKKLPYQYSQTMKKKKQESGAGGIFLAAGEGSINTTGV